MIDLVLRSVLTPGVLAARWAGLVQVPEIAHVPRARLSLGLATKMALDEIFFLTEVLSLRLVSVRDRSRIADELGAALELYALRGFLDAPSSYHLEPPVLEPTDLRSATSRGLRYGHLTFPSDYTPHAGEPGRERWLGYKRNHAAHAWLLRHPGPPRPWLVCVHGYRMGFPLADFTGFPAAWFHHELGLNVAFPVLPLHGPRKMGIRTGDGFLSGDYLDTIHLQAQAIWDIRRLLKWLRAEDGTPIGVYGLSLGGYTATLLAAFEHDLACTIAGIPATDYVGLTRWVLPPWLLRLAEYAGVSLDRVERLVRVVSPLAFAPKVAWDRRFLYAATADRLVPPAAVHALWEHWERPRLDWYEGSHTSFGWETTVRGLLMDALARSGMV
jgi:dienelactone hydrolase